MTSTPALAPSHGTRAESANAVRRIVGELARRRRRRTFAVLSVLSGLVLALAWLTLSWGGNAAAVLDYAATLTGGGEGIGDFRIGTLRLPRLLLGALVGASFGIAGALFQSVLGNPLASPDVLGVNGGGSFAAAFAIIALGLTGPVVGLAAFLGASAVATAIYLLAWRGGVAGYRFVLIGVGIAFAINAGIGYLLTRSAENDVRSALVWMVGSIGTPRWEQVAILAAIVGALLPLVVAVRRRLLVLQLGDDLAGGLGARVEPARLTILTVAVALAAGATAFAGPVAFVAFVSAPIARRLLPGATPAISASALVGVLVVLGAEFAGQHFLPGLEVPVGIITGAVGAPYLLWLLATGDAQERSA